MASFDPAWAALIQARSRRRDGRSRLAGPDRGVTTSIADVRARAATILSPNTSTGKGGRQVPRLLRLAAGPAVVLGHPRPAPAIALAALWALRAEPLPATVDDAHGGPAAGGRKRHLDLGGVGPVEPRCHRYTRRRGGSHTSTSAPVVLGMEERFSGPVLPLIGRTLPDFGPSFEKFAKGLKRHAEARARSSA